MKYIDADKLLDIIIKMQKEYATQEVTEEHKGLRSVLGGQCLVLAEIIEIIDSLQQDHIVDVSKMVEQEHIADVSKMMEQPIPDSTQLIAEWEKEKAVLEQKDFRGDAERMAYNAFLDGFVKGLGYEGTR